jgi:hypothetical protein
VPPVLAAAVTIAAVALVIRGSAGYIRDVASGAAPRLATWVVFTVAMGEGTAAAAMKGAWPSAGLTLAGTVTCAAIVAAGRRHGRRDIKRLDRVCAALALAGVGLLTAADLDPRLLPVAVAIAVSVGADGLAFAPTFANGWRGAEPWRPFAQFGLAATLTLAAASGGPAGVIYPSYEVVVNAAMAAVAVLGWRRAQGSALARSRPPAPNSPGTVSP